MIASVVYLGLCQLNHVMYKYTDVNLTKFIKLVDPINYTLQIPGIFRTGGRDRAFAFGISVETIFIVYALILNILIVPGVIISLITKEDLTEAWWCYTNPSYKAHDKYICPNRSLKAQFSAMCNQPGISCLTPENVNNPATEFMQSRMVSLIGYTYLIYILVFWRHVDTR